MKFHVKAFIFIVCAYFQTLAAQDVDPTKEDQNPSHYLTVHKGFTTETTHPEITIWTKEDPFKTPDDQIINATIILSNKLADKKRWTAILDLYAPADGKKVSLGSITLLPEDYTYESSNNRVKQITFSLIGKYFRKAVIRTWCEDLEEIEIHLHKKKNLTEQATPSNRK